MNLVVYCALSVLIPLSLIATPATPPAPSPVQSAKAACDAPECRQFDFWIGKWTVRNPGGKEVGSSEISRESQGCAIREQWKSGSGLAGMSINYYDRADGKWHQDWVGGDGAILHLRGALENGAMVMTGESPSSTGTVMNRISWTSLADHHVKQEWSSSSDRGKTWQIAFVGNYEPQH